MFQSGQKDKYGEAMSLTRRRLLRGFGIAGGSSILGASKATPLFASPAGVENDETRERVKRFYQIRTAACLAESKMPAPKNQSNGDEDLYEKKIGTFHKGLPHDQFGEVDPKAYRSMRRALDSGNSSDFERIILGGNATLSDPQGGLAFDLKGCDSHLTFMPKPPQLSGSQRASEMVENYWLALLRDVSFSSYEDERSVQNATEDLDRLRDPQLPTRAGRVSPKVLFRGFTDGDKSGPYVSQFLLQNVRLGALSVEQRYWTYKPDLDHLTDSQSWLAAQNGAVSFPQNLREATPLYLRNGRDLAAYVYSDCIIQAYLMAAEWMWRNKVPLNPSNPYTRSVLQSGFETFGEPHLLCLVAEAANLALKAVWYHKWFVHRTLRPEAYGGLVHWKMTNQRPYPVDDLVLESQAAKIIFSRYGTYLLPQAYPEGCPLHPSFGQGHSAVAGACVTVLKAFFETENFLFADPVIASRDGTSLVAYEGEDRDQLTVAGELNKLAGNISMARNFAGVHWRSDYTQGLLLGEAVALSLLRDERETFNEPFHGFRLTRFDGRSITV
jgi:hypothetical protein